VVGTRVGGLPFLLAEGEAGVVIAPDSPLELERALRHLADDPAELRRLGSAAHARQAGHFSWRVCGEALHARIGQSLPAGNPER